MLNNNNKEKNEHACHFERKMCTHFHLERNNRNSTRGIVCYLKRKMCTYFQRRKDSRTVNRESGAIVAQPQ